MRILVTGSFGQMGSTIMSELSHKHSIVGTDKQAGKFTTKIGDITDRSFVYSVTKGMDAIIHTASLHAPHIKTFTKEDFIKTNIFGTLNLLQAAVDHDVKHFIYSSTTSLYGHAMVSKEKAVWVTEDLLPEPRDIYDVTKLAAEGLCQVYNRNYGLPCVSLRISRFFPEPDHLTFIYRFYRGVDVRDAAAAHLLALESGLKEYEVFNISAASPFTENDTAELLHNAPHVLRQFFPEIDKFYIKKGWRLPKSIDRVYVIEKATKRLKYYPRYNFDHLT